MVCSKHKKFKDAAEELGINPPSLSKQIKKLEKQLNLKLFYRVVGNSSTQLTLNGEEILKKTQKIQAILRNKERTKDPLIENEDKKINIYTTQGLAWLFFPKFIHDFNQKNPGYIINITTKNPPNFLDFDELIIKSFFKTMNEVEKVKLLDVTRGFFASKGYVEKHGNPETFSELNDHQILFSLGNRLTENLGDNVMDLLPDITSTEIIFSYELCRIGGGILEFPIIYGKEKNLVQVLKKEKNFPDPLFLGCSPRRHRKEHVSLFIDALKKAFLSSNISD